MIWSNELFKDNLLSILLNSKEKLNKKGVKTFKNKNIKKYWYIKYNKLSI